MHILQLANFYGSTTGGLRVALDELAAKYLAAGARVTTIVPGRRNRQSTDAFGRTIVELRAPLVPGLGGYRMIVNTAAIERMIDELRPDVIELSDKTTLAAVATRAKTRPPVVLISHERLDEVVGQSFSRRLTVIKAIRAFNNRLADKVDAVVCCSDFAAEEFQADDGPPIRRIPLGVDLEMFTPGPTPANARPEVITVVRLSADKGPMLLVDTCRHLVATGVDHHWTVLGDGPLRPELEAAARHLPMTFLGYERDRHRIAARIAQADVGVSPGPCETFGLAALELLACGTPVVVPAQGALRELVPSEAGRVRPRTGPAFADGIADLLSGDRRAQRLAARSHAERYSWGSTAEQFLVLYDELITEHRTGPAHRTAAA